MKNVLRYCLMVPCVSLHTFCTYVGVLCSMYNHSGARVDATDPRRFPKLAAFLAPVIIRSRQLENLRREREAADAERRIRRRMRSRSLH